MNKPVRFDPEAEEEVEAAASWYNAQRLGLGYELIAAIRAAVEQIRDSPATFGQAPGVSESLGVRRCPVSRFPYALIFIELPEETRILAAAHYRRRPGYWRSRG